MRIMTSPVSKRLTPRQQKFVKALLANETITQAALDAGYSKNNPGQSGWQALQNIRRKMPQILDSHGLTNEVLIEKHLIPLLKAIDTKFFHSAGKVLDTRRVAAQRLRSKALNIAFRLKGSYARPSKRSASDHFVQVISTSTN
jgi:hypothetical protein